MTRGKLPRLAFICLFLIFADLFVSLQANETTQDLNSSLCVYNCSTMAPPERNPESSGLCIILANLAGIICCITIVKNCIVLFTFKTDGLLRLPQNYFFISLTVADLLTALVSMPVFTQYVLLRKWVLSETICHIWMAVDWTLRLASLYLRVVITIDKFFSAKYPTKYMVWRTPLKAKITIGTAWLIPGVAIFTYIFGWKQWKMLNPDICEMPFMKNKNTAFYLSILYFWMPIITIGSLYASLYATSYSKYKRYDRIRKMWHLKNKKQHKTRNEVKKQKSSNKDCEQLFDLNAIELKNLEHTDLVNSPPNDEDFQSGQISSSEYVNIERYKSEPSFEANRNNPPHCSPIIKVTSPLESDPMSKNTHLDEVLISSDEEFMKTLYNSTNRYPIEAVEDTHASTGTSFYEKKNRSKSDKARRQHLKPYTDSSDSDGVDIDTLQHTALKSKFETVTRRPRRHSKKSSTKLKGTCRKIETTGHELQGENVVQLSDRNIKENQIKISHLLEIKSHTRCADEVINTTWNSRKLHEPRDVQGKSPGFEEKQNLSVDAEKNIKDSKYQERKKVKDNLVPGDNTRFGKAPIGPKLCVASSSVRLSSNVVNIQTKSVYCDTSDRTADEISSHHTETPNLKEDVTSNNENLKVDPFMSNMFSPFPETFRIKPLECDKTSKTNVDGNLTEQVPKLLPKCKMHNTETITCNKDNTKGNSAMSEPTFPQKLSKLKPDVDLLKKPCEIPGQIKQAATAVTGSQNKDTNKKNNQTCGSKSPEDRNPLRAKTFFQQLQNTVRSSIDALSLSTAYFDSLHRSLGVVPAIRTDEITLKQTPSDIDKDKQRRCSVNPEPHFQQKTRGCLYPVIKVTDACNTRTLCQTRNNNINMVSFDRDDNIRTRSESKTRCDRELSAVGGNCSKTSFCFDAVPDHHRPDGHLDVVSKRNKKDKQKPPPSILKSRNSSRSRNRCECGSKINPPQDKRKPGQTIKINNIKTESTCRVEDLEARPRPNLDNAPIKSIYLDKISWASYLSQRSQENQKTLDKSSSEEENTLFPKLNRRRQEHSHEENFMQSRVFEEISKPVMEPCIQMKNIDCNRGEKVADIKTSTPLEKRKMLHDVIRVPLIPSGQDRRRDIDRHPIFLYGVGNPCNGQIQLDTQSMKTAFREITALSNLLCIFLMCWLPLHVVMFADAFWSGNIGERWYQLTTWLIYLNSLFNPFCYSHVNAGFLVVYNRLVGACKT